MQIRLVVALRNVEMSESLTEAAQPLSVDLNVLSWTSAREVFDQASSMAGDLVIVDRRDLGEFAESTIELFKSLPERPALVVLSEFEDSVDRARLVGAGADAVLSTRLEVAVLSEALAGVIDRRRAEMILLPLESVQRGPRLSDFVATSEVMVNFVDTAMRVARSNTSLLVLGETGVGKEHLSRAIHAESPRSHGPFVAVNCGAIPESLLESELFGHERGSFTGATRSRKGWFEQAHLGTVFLDEIGEMPTHLQVRLLRVLQDRVVRRLGSEQDIPIDVRLIAATNINIEDAVRAGTFRADLFYRLSVVALEVPPLRERQDEFDLLVEQVATDVAISMGMPKLRIAPEALGVLRSYSWPGNIRELSNVLERATLLSRDGVLRRGDLPPALQKEASPGAALGAGQDADSLLDHPFAESRRRVLDAFERNYLEAALRRERGRVGAVAKRAELDPRSLYNAMRRLGLRKEDFR